MYQPHWFFRNSRKYRERDAALLRLVQPDPAMRLLEIGSARGDTSFFFSPLVLQVTGVDAAGEAVALARNGAGERGLENVRFVEADARDLSSLGGELFDCVILADFVEHVSDEILRPVLQESLRLLVPGGGLAIYTPNLEHWAERIKASVPRLQQADHIAVRSAARVVEFVAREGFELNDLFFSGSPYPLLGAVDRLFLPIVRSCRFRTCLRALKPAPIEADEGV
jgi:SAM-dependent methyltransferase